MNNNISQRVTNFLIVIFLSTLQAAAQNINSAPSRAWTVSNPFEHKVFIENAGQFTNDEKNSNKQPILYYNKLGNIQLYFTASSITFRYDSTVKTVDDEENDTGLSPPDHDKNIKTIPQFLTMNWQNANPDVEIEVMDQVPYYFTYNNPNDPSGHTGISANAYRKLIYHNLYKGIDVEFYYPEDKGGLEYTITVNPGADPSDIKMAYSANVKMLHENNGISIISPVLNIIDHAPTAKDRAGNSVATEFSVNNNIVTFKTDNYDKTKALVIDPWITSTHFAVNNLAYDVNYDNYGNVYIGGGTPPYAINKYDKNGNLIWSYSTPFGTSLWWGDFAVDVRNGNSYIVKGLGGINPINAVKINTNGKQLAEYTDNAWNFELWRVAFDYCNNQLIVAGGLNDQAAYLDTDLNTETKILLINNAIPHDMSLLALDNQGNAYMGTNLSSFSDPGYNNVIFKLPVSNLGNPTYIVSDYHKFKELVSLTYYPPQPNNGDNYANGFNGLAANKDLLLSFDGASLRKWRPSNGTLIDSIKVSPTSFQWGGLAIDCEDHIYAGDSNSIQVYDSSLNLIGTIPLPDTVYSIKTGNGHVYACGSGYVEDINLIQPSAPTLAFTNPSSCFTSNGTVTAYPNCGFPPFTYSWSTGQTTQTITGLNIGNYTVTVQDQGCLPNYNSESISLYGNDEVFVPNAFSPNGDGVNDILFVKSECLTSIDFEVFDRWGNKVFETENLNIGWDGTYKGLPMNPGTFVYFLKANLFDGTSFEKKGTIALVR
ncbi:MAG TPA: gliding motility-associated C-terminal domain-containing protein [Bacteroidia bacterium]|nr:gliding motility-associated C-terminal domain-containing protein [Bacteroidia bacterium]